jgi:hypothetical protein
VDGRVIGYVEVRKCNVRKKEKGQRNRRGKK